MKLYISINKVLVSVAAILLCLDVAAHSALKSSVPGGGSVLNNAPKSLELTFTEPVFLLEVNFMNAEKESMAINFSQPENADIEFSVPLPVLDEGQYTVEWTAAGAEDDHTILGGFTFVVNSQEL